MKKITKVIIPAAGLGTRLLPATKSQPKEMLPIVDKPAIQHIIEEALLSGIEEILIITGRNKRALEDYFDRAVELELLLEKQGKEELLQAVRDIADIPIHYIRQKEALGLGHAVAAARQFIGGQPFAVMLGDDIVDAKTPCLSQLLDVYGEYGGSVIGVQPVPNSQVSNYGIVNPAERIKDAVWRVASLVEKPPAEEAPSNLAILGRYIIRPGIFPLLAKAKPGAGGEIQLTDSLSALARKEKVFAFNFSGRRYDIGSKKGFLEATVDFALKDPQLRDDFQRYLSKAVKGNHT
ncbi:MAG: UTP--glucose-1-phosphate uridylyltransferase GalU [Acidaminococcales bacterium]|jgi:UTP--glucose-1-phosphate uridylyltransferase|nr:UTP--glucose-1-phosphate uridylyltransferase GalU [Acidaminococcales bacterium]